jgi:hypothetical protein
MPFTLDDNGQILDEAGKPVKIGDVELKVTGAVTQATFDKRVQERLAREKETHNKTLGELREQYETRLKGATDPEEVQGLKAKLEELNEKLLTESEQAAAKAKRMQDESRREIDQHKTQADQAMTLFKEEKLNNQLTRQAALVGFLDPADVVTQLRPQAIWEETKDDKGKGTGEFVLLFRVTYVEKNKTSGKDEAVTKDLPAEQAVKILAAQKPYLVRGSGKSGSGNNGGQHGNPGNQDWTGATPRGKMAAGYGLGKP